MSERLTYIPPEAMGETLESEMEVMVEKVSKKDEWKHFTPEFVGTKSIDLSSSEVYQQIELAVNAYEDSRVSQAEGKVELHTDLPIAIVHFGDWHFGSVYTRHSEIIRKVEEVKKTPNMYVVFMANLIDNAIPSQFPDGMLVSAIPPNQQVLMMRKIIQDLDKAGKVLGAIVSPCHEGWTFKKAGQDVNALLFGYPERKFPVLENGGWLHIKVGEQDYKGALYHQVGPYESNFNETHALRQLNRLNLGMEADWVAGAHKHVAAAQEVYEGTGEHRKLVVYLRSGTEKGTGIVHDDWSIGKYGTTGEPTGQTVFLWPGQRRLAAECDFDTAVLAQQAYYIKALVDKEKS